MNVTNPANDAVIPGPSPPTHAASTTTTRYPNPLLSGVMSGRNGRRTAVSAAVPATAIDVAGGLTAGAWPLQQPRQAETVVLLGHLAAQRTRPVRITGNARRAAAHREVLTNPICRPAVPYGSLRRSASYAGIRPTRKEDAKMLDLLMVAITAAFFALMFLSIRWFDRI